MFSSYNSLSWGIARTVQCICLSILVLFKLTLFEGTRCLQILSSLFAFHVIHSQFFFKQIVKPELTKHCRLCEVCLLSLDHHCLFLTRCVAVKNHRAFVSFMIETMLANALFVRASISCEYKNSVFFSVSCHCYTGMVRQTRNLLNINLTILILFLLIMFNRF